MGVHVRTDEQMVLQRNSQPALRSPSYNSTSVVIVKVGCAFLQMFGTLISLTKSRQTLVLNDSKRPKKCPPKSILRTLYAGPRHGTSKTKMAGPIPRIGCMAHPVGWPDAAERHRITKLQGKQCQHAQVIAIGNLEGNDRLASDVGGL